VNRGLTSRERLQRLAVHLHKVSNPAMRLWVLSRLSVFLVVGATGWVLASDVADRTEPTAYLDRWRQWDVRLLERIAVEGYDAPPDGRERQAAFFPGLPLLLRAAHAVGISVTLAGLLISFVAGAVAMVALSRLGDLEGPQGTGERAVLLLVTSPTAVFLAAGYTEALFLGFAVPAWLAARRGRWFLAVVAASGATAVRVSGLFLAVALMVEFATGEGRGVTHQWRKVPVLLVPFLPPLAYLLYLKHTTGDWLAWVHAQRLGWGREFVGPVESLRRTVDAGWGGGLRIDFVWMFRAEVVAVALGVVLTIGLATRRRWAESVYVGLSVGALATSTWYLSVGRAALLWWPLWIGLARLTLKYPKALTAYLVVVAPLMVLWVALFSTGRWAG
jgi:hypothetical protein